MIANQSKKQYWKKCLLDWSKSGQLLKTWCKKNNLPYSSLWYWQKKLLPKIEENEEQESVLFSELVDPGSQSSGVELVIGTRVIRLCKNFDTETLKSCLNVVEGE
jgi:hypothetical protein